MNRKISNKALIDTLEDTIWRHKDTIRTSRWLIESGINAMNWANTTDKPRAIREAMDQLEKCTKNLRDCEHAIAALKAEKDDEQEPTD